MITYVTSDPEEYLSMYAGKLRALDCSEEYIAESVQKIRDDGIERVASSYEANLKRAGKT